jgi:hypothetical protein
MNRDSAIIIGVSIIVGCLVLGMTGRAPGTAHVDGHSEDVGRYQIIRASECNVMVLDTKTGRSWMEFVSSNQGPVHWSEDSPDVSPPAQGVLETQPSQQQKKK